MELNITGNNNVHILSEPASVEVLFSKQAVAINVSTAIRITVVEMSDCISLAAGLQSARETFFCYATCLW